MNNEHQQTLQIEVIILWLQTVVDETHQLTFLLQGDKLVLENVRFRTGHLNEQQSINEQEQQSNQPTCCNPLSASM